MKKKGSKNGLNDDVETKLLPSPAAAFPGDTKLKLFPTKLGLSVLIKVLTDSWLPESLGKAKLMYFLMSGSDDDIATMDSPDGDDSKIREIPN